MCATASAEHIIEFILTAPVRVSLFLSFGLQVSLGLCNLSQALPAPGWRCWHLHSSTAARAGFQSLLLQLVGCLPRTSLRFC